MEELPGEVLSNVFIRVLAKQVAQMRCVCKHWNTLLSEPWFIKSHLDRSIRNNEEILLFFEHGSCYDSSPGPLTARSPRFPNLELTDYMARLKLPVHKHKVDWSQVVGSVNGLMCFQYHSNNYKDMGVCIWNPSLSAVLTLPPFPLIPIEIVAIKIGFGFDPKTDDYKVLMVSLNANSVPHPTLCAVYIMRKGSWEIISQNIPLFPHQNLQGCLDAHLYWIGCTDLIHNPWTILAFDFGAETFREIPLPDCISSYDRFYLGGLDGKLCVMSHLSECEVWVMNDDGSWMKNHVFSQFKAHITPFGFTSRGEFLFQVRRDDSRFALYDPVAATTKIFNINITDKLATYRFFNYVDNLVWITPGNQKFQD